MSMTQPARYVGALVRRPLNAQAKGVVTQNGDLLGRVDVHLLLSL